MGILHVARYQLVAHHGKGGLCGRTDVPEALRSTALKSICRACRMRMTSPHSPRKKASTSGTLTEARYSSSYSEVDIMVLIDSQQQTIHGVFSTGTTWEAATDAPAERAALFQSPSLIRPQEVVRGPFLLVHDRDVLVSGRE